MKALFTLLLLTSIAYAQCALDTIASGQWDTQQGQAANAPCVTKCQPNQALEQVWQLPLNSGGQVVVSCNACTAPMLANVRITDGCRWVVLDTCVNIWEVQFTALFYNMPVVANPQVMVSYSPVQSQTVDLWIKTDPAMIAQPTDTIQDLDTCGGVMASPEWFGISEQLDSVEKCYYLDPFTGQRFEKAVPEKFLKKVCRRY